MAAGGGGYRKEMGGSGGVVSILWQNLLLYTIKLKVTEKLYNSRDWGHL